MRAALLLSIITGLLGVPAPAVAIPSDTGAPARVRPLAQAHAHNDYEHDRPLYDALDHGFTSVEADVYLVDGDLLVAHDPWDVRPERSLRSLYLDPLRERIRAGHGSVYPGERGEFQLLIDLKNQGAETYAALDTLLRSPEYAPLFTSVLDGRVRRGPVRAVVSGDRPREIMAGQADRRAFYDGRVADESDLGCGDEPRLASLVSDNWTNLFSWNGSGPMPRAERERLRELVRACHDAGQRLRLWATPDTPGPERTAVWRELAEAGVDHINTDDLAGLREFLRHHAN